MTKRIRIENADTAKFVVVAELYDVGPDGMILRDKRRILNPADMVELYIHSGCLIVVREEFANENQTMEGKYVDIAP